MVDTRRFRSGLIAGFLSCAFGISLPGGAHAADAPAAVANDMFSAGFNSEFGFTLGAHLDPKRNRYASASSQDNSNLYFTVKLPKSRGPFEQVVVGMSPKSQVIVNLRARRDFADAAACLAALELLNATMQSRFGVKSERSVHAGAWVFYNVEQAPVEREMSCNDKRMDFYVFDKKLIFQGVSESVDMQAAAAPAAQR